MSADDLSAVAVLNGDLDTMAIWHVAVEPVAQTSRLCGAWVTDDLEVQRKVIAGRKVVLLDDEPSRGIEELFTYSRGVIDLVATLEAIEQCIENLDETHRSSRTEAGGRRAPISWPVLSPVPDRGSLPPVPAGVVDDPLIRSTIAMARWFARFVDTWSAVETIRASRAHLCMGNAAPVPLPFMVVKGTAP
ncbi:Uncharacterised protein [Mycobacteroides abscessus subsp. bolletii]|uniref:hypothetical protein n=1 Tax=Mycobacteroides abscessus TaxID=36809 RepID=UPI0009A835B8|nr:hypothetical protein [Mycobacteroides abscessus]SKG74747.1 Uncharacterised protein [Mycobacteroides abscessus subsp. bolletii]SKH26348.1 Uncharacterised protein [Mycobacteroides abscessus subsp. bolletii]